MHWIYVKVFKNFAAKDEIVITVWHWNLVGFDVNIK